MSFKSKLRKKANLVSQPNCKNPETFSELGKMDLSSVNLPWVFSIASSVDGYHGVGRDARFAHGADHNFSWLLHPRIDARPAVQMSALADHRFLGSAQTNIALEHAAPVICSLTRTCRWRFSTFLFWLLLGWWLLRKWRLCCSWGMSSWGCPMCP